MRTFIKITGIYIITIFIVQFSYASKNSNQTLSLAPICVDSREISKTTNKILVISTRHFTNPYTLSFEKGVHPENKRFFFIAGQSGDSTFVTYYPSLEEAMSYLDMEKNMLVFVNGYANAFEQTLERGSKLGTRYQVNMIMFDWPTDQRPLRITAKNATKVSHNLAVSLTEINNVNIAFNTDSRVSVIFHSMGNHVARHMVQSNSINMLRMANVDNIILNAAAVKRAKHNKWVERFKNTEQIYIVTNKNDNVLRAAGLFRGARQLGNTPSKKRADNAHYINFTDIAEKEHGYYLGLTTAEKNSSKFFEFYNTVFQGLEFSPDEIALN